MKKNIEKIRTGVQNVLAKVKIKRNPGDNNSLKSADSINTTFPLIDIKIKHRLVAMLSYLNILVLIPLIFSKRHSFISYHARQGLVLAALTAFGFFLFWLPFLGWIITLLILVETIIGLINIVKGREEPLPVIGKWSVERSE